MARSASRARRSRRAASRGRISRGVLRAGTGPPGIGAVFQKTSCSGSVLAKLLYHSELANIAQKDAATSHFLRKYIDAYLLTPDVVRDILGGNRQHVASRRESRRYREIAGVSGRTRIPMQFDGRRSVHAREHGARVLRRAGTQVHHVAGAIARFVELHAHHRRFAGDHKAFPFAINAALAVAQNEAHPVRAVRHFLWSEKTRLPDILARQIAE